MLAYAVPLGYTLFVWWFSTGVILYLDGLPKPTFKYTMAGFSALAAIGFVGLAASSAVATPAAAYCGFTCALLVWAWQEVAFLLGLITGPRRTPCPADATGWRRARLAFETVLHHELALVLLAAGVAAVSWKEPNQTGLWTFVILWAMRQSAKLNVFFGVRNLSDEFLPPHLKYLRSYFVRKPMNALWPVSVLASSAVVVPLWAQASAAASTSDAFAFASWALLATLLSLAIVEHLFLVLPLSLSALWQWAMRSGPRERAATTDDLLAASSTRR